MLIFKIIFLFLSVLFTIVNLSKTVYESDIPTMNYISQAIGITGFIILQWNLWKRKKYEIFRKIKK